MRKKAIKVVCMLLCAVLALAPAGLVFTARAADSGQLTETASWSFKNGKLTVSGTGDIPANALFNALAPVREQITEVVVENGITDLGFKAFESCTALTKATLPGSLKTVASNCFRFSGLKSVTVPEGVQMIGGSAFMYCAGLESVALPQSLHAIDTAAFQGCTALKSIALPASLCSINGMAFMGTGLTSIVLPASVRCIGGWAFSGCASLKNAILSPGLTMLPDCVFQNSALDYVVLPKSIKVVAEAAFYYCTLKEIYYEGTQQEFKQIRLVNASGLENVSGTASKLFESAEVHTAQTVTDLAATRGDMDMKEGVTAGDAREVLRAAVKLTPIAPATAEYYRADVDADGVITSGDARTVLRGAVHLEDLENLQPQQGKVFSDAELTALSAFKGTVRELIDMYDVQRLTLMPTFAAAVFRGEKDVVVMLLDYNKGVIFNQRFTPAADETKLFETLLKANAAQADVTATDPGTAFIPGTGTSVSCTVQGSVYLISYNGKAVTGYNIF